MLARRLLSHLRPYGRWVTLAVLLLLGLLTGLNTVLGSGIAALKMPILGTLLGGFVSLYFSVVMARVLGVLHFVNRARLGWF